MSEPGYATSRKAFFKAVGIGTSMVSLPADGWAALPDLAPALNKSEGCLGSVLQAHDWQRWICIGAIDRYTIETTAHGAELTAAIHRIPSEADAIEWSHGDWIFGFTTQHFHIGFDGAVVEEPSTFPIGDELVGQEFSIRLVGEVKLSANS